MNQDYKYLLEQARTAVRQADWLVVVQYLQQLVAEDVVIESEMVDLAIEVLLFGDFQERWDVGKVLSKLGKSAIVPLIEILEDEEAEEESRWFAGRILGESAYPEAITALVEVLKTSQSQELNSMAAAALGNIGSPAIDALTELLAQEDTRLLAVQALSYIRSPATITPLIGVAEDPLVTVRETVIEALSSFHDSRIPPILLNALDDIAAPVRREAIVGLSFHLDLEEELSLVERLSPRLYDFNIAVCSACAIALGRLGTDSAAAALNQVLMSPHTPTSLQIEIVRALGWIKTVTSLEYLTLHLNQQLSAVLVEEIVTVLGRVESAFASLAAQNLIAWLKSNHPTTQVARVRSAIALSLSQLGDLQAVEPLTQLLTDADAGVRLHVITALKRLGVSSSTEVEP